jgi:hypothetical protein
MNEKCILVLTSRPIEELERFGSRAWVLDPIRARSCGYLVCAWNAYGEYAQTTTTRQHREAFLVAPISAIEPTPDEPGRYAIRFREFARYSKLDAWPAGRRNPVAYSTLHDLGIEIASLTFAPVTAIGSQAENHASDGPSSASSMAPLTITAAKRGLAVQFGVDPSAIEITIRG